MTLKHSALAGLREHRPFPPESQNSWLIDCLLHKDPEWFVRR